MKYLHTAILLLVSFTLSARIHSVSSPDGKVTMTVNVDDKLSYSISYNGNDVVAPSPMGFEFKGEKPMSGNMKLVGEPLFEKGHEAWNPVVRNKHSYVELDWNQMVLNLVEAGGDRRKMDIEVRAYNDGIAFRYFLYGAGKPGNRQIVKELTGMTLPLDATVWAAKYKRNYTSSQESEFDRILVRDFPTDTVAGLPLLAELSKDSYIAITEAFIDDFPGFYIGRRKPAEGAMQTLDVMLSPLPGEGEEGVKARFSTRKSTPWRVVMVGDNPGKFIESEIVRGLNPDCAIEDPSWIKPGMCAWDHWWSGEVKMEMDVIKEYIDFAATQGWPYMLIDWQWYGKYNRADADITTPAPQLDMPEILRYAKERNVRCWLWLYCTDVNRNDNFEEAFALYEKWGIAGIKIDFMDRDDQDMVNWYRRIVSKAAEHKLMVNFHGAYKPDGIERTWPNLLTREGVMGEEYSKFSERIVPSHNVTLAFTRMLAGPMDYTPGGFLNVTRKDFRKQSPTLVMNTRCAELSKFVIYESPLTVACDHPKHVIDKPGSDFLKLVPTTWDDVRFIDGYPGKFVALAKRNGDSWFIGVMNDETARTVDLDTSFLPEGSYSLTYWADSKNAGTNPTELVKKTIRIKAGDSLKVKMAVGGGYVGIITKNNN